MRWSRRDSLAQYYRSQLIDIDRNGFGDDEWAHFESLNPPSTELIRA